MNQHKLASNRKLPCLVCRAINLCAVADFDPCLDSGCDAPGSFGVAESDCDEQSDRCGAPATNVDCNRAAVNAIDVPNATDAVTVNVLPFANRCATSSSHDPCSGSATDSVTTLYCYGNGVFSEHYFHSSELHNFCSYLKFEKQQNVNHE